MSTNKEYIYVIVNKFTDPSPSIYDTKHYPLVRKFEILGKHDDLYWVYDGDYGYPVYHIDNDISFLNESAAKNKLKADIKLQIKEAKENIRILNYRLKELNKGAD